MRLSRLPALPCAAILALLALPPAADGAAGSVPGSPEAVRSDFARAAAPVRHALAPRQQEGAEAVRVQPEPERPSGPRGKCARCHRGLDEPRLRIPAGAFGQSVHGQAGLDCVACHGGDATADTEEAAHQGTVRKPPRTRIPEICSRCHSSARYMHRYDPGLRVDQMDRYRTSVHGERLLRLGDTRVAVCTDCHSAHFVTAPSEERSSVHPRRLPGTCGGCHANPRRMAPYDIPTDQLADYKQSVHWEMVSEEGDLSSPVCNDCHGNHGAAPPEVEWIGEVCSQCHSRIAGFYSASPHDSVFAYLGEPGCATCHGNHRIERATDDMLALDGEGVCGGSGCHSPDERGGRVALAMREAIDSLQAVHRRADSILHVAELAGMPVSQAQFELSQTQTSLIKARAAVHTARLDSVEAAVAEGIEVARSGYRSGQGALEELEYRRVGLGVSAVIILVLIGALVAKIREVDRQEGRTMEGSGERARADGRGKDHA